MGTDESCRPYLVTSSGLCHHEDMTGSLFVPRVLWVALFTSTLIYLVVLELVEVQSSASWETLVYPLAFIAVTTGGASLLLPRFMHKQSQSGDSASQKQSRYLTTLILALALAESVATFGLVLGFLGAPATVVVPFFAVAWILMVIRFPTQEKRDRPST